MMTSLMSRKVIVKELTKFFPDVSVYESNVGIFDGPVPDFEQIKIVREIIEYTRAHDYKVRLEFYKHHKVLDIICEDDCKDNLYINSVVISYSTKSKEIVGCDICDTGEDPFFSNFVSAIVFEYIEPIRDKLEWHEVDNGNK